MLPFFMPPNTRNKSLTTALASFILFALITLIAPDYYFGVKDHPIAQAALILGVLLLVIGNVILYRMVNFRF